MGKEYAHQYYFAGGGTQAGSMVCVVCKKKINKKEDWLSTMKDVDKGHDWKYQCRHRKCVNDQSGWIALEKEQRIFDSKVKRIQDFLSNYIKGGDIDDAFQVALKNLGVDDE